MGADVPGFDLIYMATPVLDKAIHVVSQETELTLSLNIILWTKLSDINKFWRNGLHYYTAASNNIVNALV